MEGLMKFLTALVTLATVALQFLRELRRKA